MTEHIKLKAIRFRVGARPGDSALTIDMPPVVVLVGPNNSGKSLTLREIEQFTVGVSAPQPRTIVEWIDFSFPRTMDAVMEQLHPFFAPPPINNNNPNMIWLHRLNLTSSLNSGQSQVERLTLERLTAQWEQYGPRRDPQHPEYTHNLGPILSVLTTRLDGRNRFALASSQTMTNVRQSPGNHLTALVQDSAARKKLQELTADAFGQYVVIDPTAPPNWVLRMSPRPPESEEEELGFGSKARAFYDGLPALDQLGDGVQCYVGLLSAVSAWPYSIMLIDEPEAFLHPPQANRLGGALAEIAAERDASLVIATHSSDFLMGAILSRAPVAVVRLTYDGKVGTARMLPPEDIRALSRQPLLRSANVLSAVFHTAAIVTESDADRAFYEEVNRRMVDEGTGRGVPDALFLNAQGLSSIPKIIEPLRRIGIPAVAMTDLDVLNNNLFSKYLEVCGVPVDEQQRICRQAQEVVDAFASVPHSSSKSPLKALGIRALSGTERGKAIDLLRELGTFGFFPAPNGELESWLPQLKFSGAKPQWIVYAFSRMGDDPNDPAYMRPTDDDVWLFLDNIASWVNNPNRLGT